jgi:hypothetical protein
MPEGRLYNWEDMARMGRQSPGTRSGRKLACCLSVYEEAISHGRSKDSSCAYKGLVTNWLHHNMHLTRRTSPRACTLLGVRLIGVHLMGVYLMGVYLMSVYLVGVYVTGRHLIGRVPHRRVSRGRVSYGRISRRRAPYRRVPYGCAPLGHVPHWVCTSQACISDVVCLRLSDFSIWGKVLTTHCRCIACETHISERYTRKAGMGIHSY